MRKSFPALSHIAAKLHGSTLLVSFTDIPKFIHVKISLSTVNYNLCLSDALMSGEYIGGKRPILLSNYLAQFSGLYSEKATWQSKKEIPQKIFQQGYLAAFTSRVNSEMLWYHNWVEEPESCSGFSENVHLPQNFLQKFKK